MKCPCQLIRSLTESCQRLIGRSRSCPHLPCSKAQNAREGLTWGRFYEGNGATIYLIIPLQYMKSHASLMRLWITAFTKYIVSRGVGNRRSVNVILDECASVMGGHGEALEEMLTVGRGFGVKVTAIFQSMAQLGKLFPEGQEGVLLANTSQIFFGTQDWKTAEYISNLGGESTIIVSSGGISTGTTEQASKAGQGGSTSYSNTTSDNWQQLGRKLLKPEEVVGLDPRVAITFTPGVPPLWTRPRPVLRERMERLWRHRHGQGGFRHCVPFFDGGPARRVVDGGHLLQLVPMKGEIMAKEKDGFFEREMQKHLPEVGAKDVAQGVGGIRQGDASSACRSARFSTT